MKLELKVNIGIQLLIKILNFYDVKTRKPLILQGLEPCFHDHAKHPGHDHDFYPLQKASQSLDLQRLKACQKRGKNFHDDIRV